MNKFIELNINLNENTTTISVQIYHFLSYIKHNITLQQNKYH